MGMQISTFFNPALTWREQLTPLMGLDEVDRLGTKLREMNVTNLDSKQLPYTSMFFSPPHHLESQFDILIRDIGSWPLVS